MTLLVVGSVAFDTITTPSGSVDHVLGGSATYFSLSASHFTEVRLVAVVGDDFGSKELQIFQGNPIDLTGLQRREGRTFHWVGEYSKDLKQAHTLETHLNVFEDFDPNLPSEYRDSQYLFLGNIDPTLQLRVLSQVNNPELIGCDTMNFWITGKRKDLERTLSEVGVLIINDEEVQLFTGDRDFVKGARKILDMGPHTVVVKLGIYGVAMVTKSRLFFAPAYPVVNVVDPTGAGDSFAGGFMGYLAREKRTDEATLRRGVVFGSVMSSFTIESFSTKGIQNVNPEDIKDRFESFRDFLSFD